MKTLIKRIIFILIILWIIYSIYWFIDRQGAKDLKESFVDTTQETIQEIKKDSSLDSEEPLGDISEITSVGNIIVSDPEIKEPELSNPDKPIIQETNTSTSSPKTSTSKKSSNILFELFN